MVLSKYGEELEYDNIRIQAAMHGIKLDKTDEKGEKTMSSTTVDVFHRGAEKMPMMFKDPAEYTHMTQEEREVLTKKMMGVHRRFFTSKGILAPKKPKQG